VAGKAVWSVTLALGFGAVTGLSSADMVSRQRDALTMKEIALSVNFHPHNLDAETRYLDLMRYIQR
jgi:hypothetical protein